MDKTLDNFERKYQERAFDVISRYDWSKENAKSIVLLSPEWYGAGKTHLVCGLVHRIINTAESAYINSEGFIKRRRCPVYFTTETDLLLRIRSTYNRQPGDDGEREEGIYNKLNRYQLLIIDDVGKVKPRDYAFLQQVYYRIIDSRYVNEQPIILTTNLRANDLEAHIGGSCADRLREMAGSNFVVMKGESYRKKVVNHDN
jgi:DNA replication protein DnaC